MQVFDLDSVTKKYVVTLMVMSIFFATLDESKSCASCSLPIAFSRLEHYTGLNIILEKAVAKCVITLMAISTFSKTL